MELEKEVVRRVALSGAELRMWSERARVPHYDPSPKETRYRAWVDVVSNGHVSEINTLGEICAVLRIGLRPDLTGDEVAEVASIVNFLLGAGRVVVDHPAFAFLERQFEVTLADGVPRFEGGDLKFLVLRVDLRRGSQELESIDVDLESAHVRRTPVRSRD